MNVLHSFSKLQSPVITERLPEPLVIRHHRTGWLSGLHRQGPSSGEQTWSCAETVKHLLPSQILKAHGLPPGIRCLQPVPEETWILTKKDAKQNTNRTPSAAARSAAWPRTPAESAPRCATSWGRRGGGGRGRAGGRAARPGLQRPGRHERRTPPAPTRRQRPREAGRGGAARGRPRGRRPACAVPLRAADRCRAGGGEWGRRYSLIAPGTRGRGSGRPRRRPDVLPWRTPRAPEADRGRAQERAAAAWPSRSPTRGSFGPPRGRQVTSPRGVRSDSPPQAPSPCGSSSLGAPTARRLCDAGPAGRWSAESAGALRRPPPRGLQLPECTANAVACLLPPSAYGFFPQAQPLLSDCGSRNPCSGLPLPRCAKAPGWFQTHRVVLFEATVTEEPRRRKKGDAAAWKTGCWWT